MGSLQNKLSWLIDRKIELINFIKSKTNSVNTTGSLITSGTPYGDINMSTIVSNLNAFYSYGFTEVVYCRMYNASGTVASGVFPDYTSRGVYVSVTKNGTGQYTVSMTRAPDLTYDNAIFYLYTYGGHRGSTFDSNIYSTASPTSTWDASTLTWKIITGDQSDYYDGYFNIVIFAVYIA